MPVSASPSPSENGPSEDPKVPAESAGSPILRLLIEAGPLGVFFFTNWKFGIFTATGVFMVAILLSLAVSWLREKRLPVMPLVTAVFVLVFGGLTIYLHDEVFIKLKPTLVNTLFAAILLVGLARGRSFLKVVMGTSIQITEEGWRTLTLRWGLFFLFLAGLNEAVWRNVSTDTWVNFKVFGLMPLTLVFAISQVGLLTRHQIESQETPGLADDQIEN